MGYLSVLIIISAAVFAPFTVFTQVRLNRHTDALTRFFIAAMPYNFNPLKDMAKKTLKYLLLAAGAFLILAAAAAAAYGIIDKAVPDLLLTARVLSVSLAAYALNAVVLFFCAAAYVKYKVRNTPAI